MSKKLIATIFVLLVLISSITEAGPLCQAACCAVLTQCNIAAVSVVGIVTAGIGAPLAVLACNAAYGACIAVCAASPL
ncbi:29126_t:CDS:2 [Gigaspora margarita]|uniref:Uncharacterized protein n=2 Tax=Gigaspora margarita TaxID=4874 RepID=A0A8H4EK67_GIGMA|nr:hypothetical protein F8M41_019871 [Gigaspora margarita]CAG8747217.1 29126_t:CDS:2 [Gigaspora margarita]